MRKILTSVGVAAAVVGLVVGTAGPASALGPHVTLSVSQAYHHPDSYGRVQHYNKFSNGKYTYGSWAPKGTYSKQAACYTGVVAYNYNFKAS